MSVCRRRIDSSGRINEIIFNSIFRDIENQNYILIPFEEKNAVQYSCDHTDYVILSIINAYKNNFIEKKTCFDLIDKVEGYFYAFESNLINGVQLCTKLNFEIMIEELNQDEWHFLGVFNGDMYK